MWCQSYALLVLTVKSKGDFPLCKGRGNIGKMEETRTRKVAALRCSKYCLQLLWPLALGVQRPSRSAVVVYYTGC